MTEPSDATGPKPARRSRRLPVASRRAAGPSHRSREARDDLGIFWGAEPQDGNPSTMVRGGSGRDWVGDSASVLYQDRTITIFRQIDDVLAEQVVTQLLVLEKLDPAKPITILISSPGGYVNPGMAIYDAMKMVRCPIRTVCLGHAQSMAAVLFAAGTPGMREIAPNAKVMIHQPSGGASGKSTDVEIQAAELSRLRRVLATKLAEDTGQPVAKVLRDYEKDLHMEAADAVAYGIADSIVAIPADKQVRPAPRRDGHRTGPGVSGRLVALRPGAAALSV